MRIDGELLPRPGVYAGRVVEGGASHPAAINLGTNPTFTTGDVLSLEAHVLSYDGDLYDRRLRVEFHHRLRAEERFASVGELVAQIHRDIAATRAHFQGKGE